MRREESSWRGAKCEESMGGKGSRDDRVEEVRFRRRWWKCVEGGLGGRGAKEGDRRGRSEERR